MIKTSSLHVSEGEAGETRMKARERQEEEIFHVLIHLQTIFKMKTRENNLKIQSWLAGTQKYVGAEPARDSLQDMSVENSYTVCLK